MDEPVAPMAAQDADSRTSAAFARLRADILTGRLKPGEKLKVSMLSRHYGLGPTPVREALMLLTSGALVERIDQRGFSVKPVTLEEFDELFKTRCWLEAIAIRESIAAANSQWHEQLVVAVWRLGQKARTANGGENPEWEALHRTFHELLLNRCGSRFLLKTCTELYDLNTRYRHVARAFEQKTRDVGAEHQAIVDTVIEGDADGAVELLLSHYRKTAEILRQSLPH